MAQAQGQLPSVSVNASANQGVQVGWNGGTIEATINLPPEPLEPTPRPFASIPFYRDLEFVDRGNILDQVDDLCSKPPSRVALVGLGGVGKSQLAIEFAHRVAAGSPDRWVFWVHASTHARILEGFKAIANNVKLYGRNQPKADIFQLVYDWLSNERNGKWLIILDSADDHNVLYDTVENTDNGRPVAAYLPQSQNGSIILTTRNKTLAFKLTGAHERMIEIGSMTQKEALLLLANRLGSLSDVDMAADLVRVLDHIPLAISQAAAYIRMRAPRSSPQQYLTDFRRSEHKRVKLLSHDAGDLRRDLGQDGSVSNAILITWQVSFDYIRSTSPSAANLLSLMSFFNRQGIPESLLRLSKNAKSAEQTIDVEEAADSESDHSDSHAADSFEEDITTLRDYSLIMFSEATNTFEMHGLVQLSTTSWLKALGNHEMFKEHYVKLLADSFPSGDYKNWATCEALFAHVEAAVNCQPTEDSQAGIWASLLDKGAVYALEKGMYAIAERMVRESSKSHERRLGKESVATLESISLFAIILLQQGQWKEAEKLLMQVMETRKSKLGADHPDTLTSIANLASTYNSQGRWEEAEKLEVQVVEIIKSKLGADHPDTLTSIGNLASTYSSQGRWEEAEKLEVQVMETRKSKLGADHLNTLTSIANLAVTYNHQGRWEEAEKLEVQVMETRKSKLGADHPDTLTSIANLAVTYQGQGRLEEAEKLEAQVMEGKLRRLQGRER